ncbi:MAG TPA: hypothetical protein VGB22_11045 [candidate division Zixibacteria bacterium]|jgi:hypothetical protein
MTSITIEEQETPYRHVVSINAVRDAVRLLIAPTEPRGENSIYLLRVTRPKNRSILSLEGLGSEIWRGVDPVNYVRELRDEW